MTLFVVLVLALIAYCLSDNQSYFIRADALRCKEENRNKRDFRNANRAGDDCNQFETPRLYGSEETDWLRILTYNDTLQIPDYATPRYVYTRFEVESDFNGRIAVEGIELFGGGSFVDSRNHQDDVYFGDDRRTGTAETRTDSLNNNGNRDRLEQFTNFHVRARFDGQNGAMIRFERIEVEVEYWIDLSVRSALMDETLPLSKDGVDVYTAYVASAQRRANCQDLMLAQDAVLFLDNKDRNGPSYNYTVNATTLSKEQFPQALIDKLGQSSYDDLDAESVVCQISSSIGMIQGGTYRPKLEYQNYGTRTIDADFPELKVVATCAHLDLCSGHGECNTETNACQCQNKWLPPNCASPSCQLVQNCNGGQCVGPDFCKCSNPEDISESCDGSVLKSNEGVPVDGAATTTTAVTAPSEYDTGSSNSTTTVDAAALLTDKSNIDVVSGTPEPFPILYIILIAAGGVLFCVIAAVVVFCFLKKGDDDSSDSGMMDLSDSGNDRVSGQYDSVEASEFFAPETNASVMYGSLANVADTQQIVYEPLGNDTLAASNTQEVLYGTLA